MRAGAVSNICSTCWRHRADALSADPYGIGVSSLRLDQGAALDPLRAGDGAAGDTAWRGWDPHALGRPGAIALTRSAQTVGFAWSRPCGAQERHRADAIGGAGWARPN